MADTDPLADVLRQADDVSVRYGVVVESAYVLMARAARGHIAAEIEDIPRRPWDMNDADSAEARSARAYGSGLADAARIARGES